MSPSIMDTHFLVETVKRAAAAVNPVSSATLHDLMDALGILEAMATSGAMSPLVIRSYMRAAGLGDFIHSDRPALFDGLPDNHPASLAILDLSPSAEALSARLGIGGLARVFAALESASTPEQAQSIMDWTTYDLEHFRSAIEEVNW